MTQAPVQAVAEIECFRNDSQLPLQIELSCTEFSWNCPSVAQPDYGTILIKYEPDERIVETKSLKLYLQQYRYLSAFNEELTERLCLDFAYWVRPHWVEVKLLQNSRGGIANTSLTRFDSYDPTQQEILAKYRPQADFSPETYPMLEEAQKNGTHH